MLSLKKISILLNTIVFSLFALFVSESTIAAPGETKDNLVLAEDDWYEYKLTHKATPWSGVVGVLDIADKKTKEIIYHEEGLPFMHVCEGNKSIFTEYKVTQQSTLHEVSKRQFMFFCATNGGKYSVLAVFSQGTLKARVRTVESPEIIHKYETGAMHFKIGHKYPLLEGSIGRFYEIFDFDPWGFNSARFMPSYDEMAIQEYKKLFLEMAEAVKRDANSQRFYLEPMLSMLTSIGDANLTCSAIESGALAFATPEQIKNAIISNAGRGYPYFNAAICNR